MATATQTKTAAATWLVRFEALVAELPEELALFYTFDGQQLIVAEQAAVAKWEADTDAFQRAINEGREADDDAMHVPLSSPTVAVSSTLPISPWIR